MSTIAAEIMQVSSVLPHPNADRLEVATIGGATVVSQKGNLSPNQLVVYFPPNLLLPKDVAEDFGVAKYLKHAIYPGEIEKSQCRVGACRLRGVPSFGFAIPITGCPPFKAAPEVGQNVSGYFRAVKYEPSVKVSAADIAPDHPLFHRYTDIENYQRYPDAIPAGTPVRITEKIHGTNCRLGMIGGELMAGSHNLRRKQPEGQGCLYWEPMRQVEVLLWALATAGPVIIFGEVFGPGIQDLDYGVPAGQRSFCVFDISVNGRYLQWEQVDTLCRYHNIETVPLIFVGEFDASMLDTFVQGNTAVGQARSKYTGREGVVITPLEEAHSDVLGGRMILKYISADYLDRKDSQDNA